MVAAVCGAVDFMRRLKTAWSAWRLRHPCFQSKTPRVSLWFVLNAHHQRCSKEAVSELRTFCQSRPARFVCGNSSSMYYMALRPAVGRHRPPAWTLSVMREGGRGAQAHKPRGEESYSTCYHVKTKAYEIEST